MKGAGPVTLVSPATGRRSDPLRSLTDAELAQKQKAALAAANRGAHILGPNSLHCIAVEIARRKASGLWNPPQPD